METTTAVIQNCNCVEYHQFRSLTTESTIMEPLIFLCCRSWSWRWDWGNEKSVETSLKDLKPKTKKIKKRNEDFKPCKVHEESKQHHCFYFDFW